MAVGCWTTVCWEYFVFIRQRPLAWNVIWCQATTSRERQPAWSDQERYSDVKRPNAWSDHLATTCLSDHLPVILKSSDHLLRTMLILRLISTMHDLRAHVAQGDATTSQTFIVTFMKICMIVSINTVKTWTLYNKQARDIHPSLDQCWASVVDGGPTLIQNGWMSLACLVNVAGQCYIMRAIG